MSMGKERIRRTMERAITVPLTTLVFILLVPYLVARRLLGKDIYMDDNEEL